MKALPLAVIANLRQFFFKTFLEFSKAFQSRISKHRMQLSLAVKNLVCFIYFKELLEIGTKLIQIEQALRIGAKLLQIGAAPVVKNWAIVITNLGSSSYCKLGQNYYKLGRNHYKSGQALQIEAIITNRCITKISQ